MTARDQSRHFASFMENVKNYGDVVTFRDVADGVSDIWEPLLRDLFDVVTRMIVTGEDDESWTDADDDRLNEVYDRTREALGASTSYGNPADDEPYRKGNRDEKAIDL